MRVFLIGIIVSVNIAVWGWAIYSNEGNATKQAIRKAKTPVVAVATYKNVSEILLSPVIVTATDNNKRNIRQVVSVSLWFSDDKKAAYACRYGPRLREALFRKLKATPIKSDQRGKLNLIGIAEQIKPAMAKALNKNTIQLVQVVQGDRKISSTQISMLNRNGCVRIFQKN